MKNKVIIATLLLLAAGIGFCGDAGYSVDTIPNPTLAGTGYVTSIGGYLTDDEVDRINALIAAIKQDTTVEIAVVVVPSLAEDIFTASQKIFDSWKIGKADKDNGLLIVASIDDHKFRTHTGYGMEGTFTDAAISFLQESIVIPEFKEGNYGVGIINYLTKIGEIVRDPTVLEEVLSGGGSAGPEMDQAEREAESRRMERPPFSEVAVPALIFGGAGLAMLIGALVALLKEIRAVLANRKKKYDSYSRVIAIEGKGIGKNGFGISIFLFPFGAVFFTIGLLISGQLGWTALLLYGVGIPAGALVLSLLAMLWRSAIRNGIIGRWREVPRKCPECGGAMHKLPETDDDRYLKPTQVREEEIKSEDYDVWLCDACSTTTIEKFRAGRYALFIVCPKCKALAARQTKRETIKSPTYTNAGEDRLHFECQGCSFCYAKSVLIPKLTRSSGGSGSGFSGGGYSGGGSGGGSSGGGSSFGGGSSGGGGSTSGW